MRALDRLLDFVCRPLILLFELSELRRDARYSIEAHAAGRLAVNCAKAARYLVVSLACLAVAGWLGYLLVGMVAELGVLEAWPLAQGAPYLAGRGIGERGLIAPLRSLQGAAQPLELLAGVGDALLVGFERGPLLLQADL